MEPHPYPVKFEISRLSSAAQYSTGKMRSSRFISLLRTRGHDDPGSRGEAGGLILPVVKRDFRPLIAQSALVCCSLLAGFILVEVAYRAYAYVSIYERLLSAGGRALIEGKYSSFRPVHRVSLSAQSRFPRFPNKQSRSDRTGELPG